MKNVACCFRSTYGARSKSCREEVVINLVEYLVGQDRGCVRGRFGKESCEEGRPLGLAYQIMGLIERFLISLDLIDMCGTGMSICCYLVLDVPQ